MLTVPIDRVDLQPFGADGAFYRVALKRGESPLKCFMQEDDTLKKDDNTLSAHDMLKEFRKEVKKCVKIMQGIKLVHTHTHARTHARTHTHGVSFVSGMEMSDIH